MYDKAGKVFQRMVCYKRRVKLEFISNMFVRIISIRNRFGRSRKIWIKQALVSISNTSKALVLQCIFENYCYAV